MHINTDRTFRIDADRDAVWDAIGRVEDYRRWWPWLFRFDSGGLEAGQRWDCTVRPPLPYELRFAIDLIDVVAPERIVADVSGDIAGSAELVISAVDAGTGMRLVSSLAPQRGTLKVVTKLVPWMAQYGHDWVLDNGVRQFRRRAL